MNALEAIAIVIVGAVGYLVMAEAMRSCSMFRCPRIIAALVVALACIGLRQAGDGLVAVLAIPSATLLLAGGVVWIAMRISGAWKKCGKNLKSGKALIAVEEPSPSAFHNPWRTGK